MAWAYSDELKAKTGNGWSEEPEPQTSKMAAIQTSQNGYVANNRSLIATLMAGGVQFPVRKGPCGELLMWAAERWHREVEPLVPGTCWGFAERDIIGSNVISNHSSGTAIDINAPQHPLATNPSGNFTAAQIETVRRIVADAKGALRWGGDYTGRKDGMHLEINAPEDHVAAVLASVTGGAPVAQDPNQQIDEIHQQLLGVLKAWGGGVTDAQGTPYNALQFAMRNNVEIHQTALMCQQLLKQVAAKPPGMLRSDVNAIAATVAEHPAIQALASTEEITTVSFWKAAGEQAATAFAASMLSLLGAGVVDILSVAWTTDLRIAGGVAVVSVLKSLVASQVGTKGTSLFLKGGN